MANPSEASLRSRTARYAKACAQPDADPQRLVIESRKIDEARLYLVTREPGETVGQWRKRDTLRGHLERAIDTFQLVGGIPRCLLDPAFAREVLGE